MKKALLILIVSLILIIAIGCNLNPADPSTDPTDPVDPVDPYIPSSFSYDESFSNNGIYIMDKDETNANSGLYSFALQQDGKIVGYGASGGVIYLIRFNTDGTIDQNFGTDGYASIPAEITTKIYTKAVTIQSDGKIVILATGTYFDKELTIARYSENGLIDTDFGTAGVIEYAPDGIDIVGRDIICQSDGKILVAGSYNNSGALDNMGVMRFNVNGTLDGSFGTAGIFTHANAAGGDDRYDYAFSITLDTDGSIFVAGSSELDTSTRYGVIWKLTTSGILDTNFNEDGIYVHSDEASGFNIIKIYNNSIFTAGNINNPSGYQWHNAAVFKISQAGILDNQWAQGSGIFQTSLLGHDYFYDIDFDSEGNIFATGKEPNYATLYKIDNEGNSVKSLLFSGPYVSAGDTFATHSHVGNDIAVQGDDKVIFGGYIRESNTQVHAFLCRTNN